MSYNAVLCWCWYQPITLNQKKNFPPKTFFFLFSSLPFQPRSTPELIATRIPPAYTYTHIIMIAARSLATKSISRVAANSVRVFSTTSRTQYLVPSDEQQAAAVQKQSPNRAETWAESQKPRSEALKGVRTLQRNLEQQPQPYAAIDLISKVPIIYLHDNTAVCDGGKGVQGHPKIFINLDKPKAHACLYCKSLFFHCMRSL